MGVKLIRAAKPVGDERAQALPGAGIVRHLSPNPGQVFEQSGRVLVSLARLLGQKPADNHRNKMREAALAEPAGLARSTPLPRDLAQRLKIGSELGFLRRRVGRGPSAGREPERLSQATEFQLALLGQQEPAGMQAPMRQSRGVSRLDAGRRL